jgi:2-dehydropantoate 2-reductase
MRKEVKFMRLLVVGAGSTGGYFGGRLTQAGRDVTFLVRPPRAAALRANGLELVSPHGNVTLAPKIIEAHQVDAPYEAVLLTVKAFSLEASMGDFASAVGPNTVILPVLNGMKHVETLGRRFGTTAVGGCVCIVTTTLDESGRIVQLSESQSLTYGEMDGARSARMAELDAFMHGGGFGARLSSEIAREMWEKWALLASLGGITCLMRGSVGEIQAATGGTEFALRFLDEVLTIVRAVCKSPSSEFVAAARAMLTAKDSNLTSSMYRDLQQGRPIEADQIIGDLLARAEKADVSAPLLRTAFAHLSVYEHRLKSPD